MKQYLKLLMFREGKEVLGKGGYNLWLLTLVLIATFMSIAFSEGSMNYLRDKMEDPFTNWVSINKSTDDNSFIKFWEALAETSNMKRFKYNDVLKDQYTNYTIQGIDEHHQHYLECRFFERMNTPIIKAILSKDNVIAGACADSTLLVDNSLGFIITLDAAKKLGYNEQHLPTYISYLAFGEGADTLGITVISEQFVPIDFPVLGVVRRLPGNVDMVAANFFYEQQHLNDNTYPFDFNVHENYLHQLNYFLSENVTDSVFESTIRKILPDSLKTSLAVVRDYENLIPMQCWKKGRMVTVELSKYTLPREIFHKVALGLHDAFPEDDIHRVFNLETESHPSQRSAYLSVCFTSLDSIRSFERFAKDQYHIQLEMSQVASKENFNAVTVMAAILSAAMVIFSLICIIMFLVNMLQSYFQKVKRNIGTFKAFGMNAIELTSVYIVILISIVCLAVIFALLSTWLIQVVLPYMGVEKDGFNYLCLWNNTTYLATAVVLVSTIVTVCVVMARMLGRTPGDLIYDR